MILISAIFRLAILTALGYALWRVLRALERKFAIVRARRTALVAVLGCLLSAVAVTTIVQHARAFVNDRRQREESNAYYQAHKEEWRRQGLYLSPEDTKRQDRLCPPEQVIEFRLEGRSFYLPWKQIREQWTIKTAVWASTGGEACPSAPVEVGELFFDSFDPEVARERNLNLSSLTLATDAWPRIRVHSVASNLSSRVTYVDGGYVEDVTDEWRARNRYPPSETKDHRVYRLQQAPTADGVQAAPVEISCSTYHPIVGPRGCFASYFHYAGLIVRYNFFAKGGSSSQNRALRLPDGPVEPDEFLAFDARIRKWLDDLQKKPAI
jgi:hypothetical protein